MFRRWGVCPAIALHRPLCRGGTNRQRVEDVYSRNRSPADLSADSVVPGFARSCRLCRCMHQSTGSVSGQRFHFRHSAQGHEPARRSGPQQRPTSRPYCRDGMRDQDIPPVRLHGVRVRRFVAGRSVRSKAHHHLRKIRWGMAGGAMVLTCATLAVRSHSGQVLSSGGGSAAVLLASFASSSL